MLPRCALLCLVEVSLRPAERSSQVWLKDKRLTGSRLHWSAKLKDKDRGWRMQRQRTGFQGRLDSWFYLEVCQLLNGVGTLNQLWKLRFRAVSKSCDPPLQIKGVTRLCFSFRYVLCGFRKGFFLLNSLRCPVGGDVGEWGTGVTCELFDTRMFVFLASGGHWTQTSISPLLFVIFIDRSCSISRSYWP